MRLEPLAYSQTMQYDLHAHVRSRDPECTDLVALERSKHECMMYSSACVRSSKTGKVVTVVYANNKSFIHVMSLLNNLYAEWLKLNVLILCIA